MLSSDIVANLEKYIGANERNAGVQPSERYASFDYCFNYFQHFRDLGVPNRMAEPENIQSSCLQLAFYLASWGMLRGSSALLQKSVKFYEALIHYLAVAPNTLWEIDANAYSPENIKLLLDCRKQISHALSPCRVTDTLATKIMMGVFGNVPAFDSAFKAGFGASTFGKFALERIREFYEEHQAIIENYRIPTIDFASGMPTNRLYSRAKVIDMIFFVEGSQ